MGANVANGLQALSLTAQGSRQLEKHDDAVDRAAAGDSDDADNAPSR